MFLSGHLTHLDTELTEGEKDNGGFNGTPALDSHDVGFEPPQSSSRDKVVQFCIDVDFSNFHIDHSV